MLSSATATRIWSVLKVSIAAGVATGQYTQLYIPNTTTGNYFALDFAAIWQLPRVYEFIM